MLTPLRLPSERLWPRRLWGPCSVFGPSPWGFSCMTALGLHRFPVHTILGKVQQPLSSRVTSREPTVLTRVGFWAASQPVHGSATALNCGLTLRLHTQLPLCCTLLWGVSGASLHTTALHPIHAQHPCQSSAWQVTSWRCSKTNESTNQSISDQKPNREV